MEHAAATFRALDFTRWLCVPGALDAVWYGDRAGTLIVPLDEPKLRAIIGNKLGWLVPEKEQRAGRRKSQRRARYAPPPPPSHARLGTRPPSHCRLRALPLHRWQGYVLPDPEKGEMRYSTETKELTIFLPSGFYGANLDFVKGVPPPPCPDGLGKNPRYDIVERKWIARKDAGIITHGRAVQYYGVE